MVYPWLERENTCDIFQRLNCKSSIMHSPKISKFHVCKKSKTSIALFFLELKKEKKNLVCAYQKYTKVRIINIHVIVSCVSLVMYINVYDIRLAHVYGIMSIGAHTHRDMYVFVYVDMFYKILVYVIMHTDIWVMHCLFNLCIQKAFFLSQ